MIECYYKECTNHEFNHIAESEPFCNNQTCTASDEQLLEFDILRKEYLASYNLPATIF